MVSSLMFHINNLSMGGAERVVINLSSQFTKLGIKVFIATNCYADEEYELPEGVTRIHIGLNDGEDDLSRRKKQFLRKDRLKKAMLDNKPEVVLSFCRNSNYRAVMAGAGAKVPVIVSSRSNPAVDYAGKKQKLLSSYFYGKAKGAVFQSEEAKSFFTKKIQNKSTVILNPLNEKYLNCEKATVRRKVIATAGRLDEAKDQITLIKAFERLMNDYPEYKLEIYGGKSVDNTCYMLKEYVASHKLQDKVIFMGNVKELEKKMFDAAVFVLSSKYEGMPNALIEAMAMKMPVVSTDCPCGGPRLLIEEGYNGLLCDVSDDKDMAIAIRKFLDNPEKAEELAENAGEIVNKMMPEAIAKEWLDYIDKCLSK